ncbi:MAG: 4-hydroxy-tetrahydrodipicolinate reductase [Treponema sp.]|jgi:4-hydroxy-tetrahydrodipicolinate reductase|nr:4-hydroxy-tetrahydrodipicolinate reductase [Treponema sp.]
MNIAIVGYGRMGRLIEAAARERGHHVSVVVDPLTPGPRGYRTVEAAEFGAAGDHDAGDRAAGDGAGGTDVAVEFSRPDAAAGNIMALAKRGIAVVSGTTGWYDRMEEVTQAVTAAGTALLWASNFSLGVNLFYRIAWYAAQLMDPFEDYDAGGWESHHNKKADSPSGTAKTLAEGVLARMKRKRRAVYQTLDRPPAPEELHYPSLRLGAAPGTHSLIFDSAADTIEITHRARNREGFAAGALAAAQWLARCPGPGLPAGEIRRGIFTMDDVLNDLETRHESEELP